MSLLLALLAGCSEQGNGSEDGEWDFVNPSVCFFVSDAATGANLLDPGAAGSICGRPIAVVYNGGRYVVAAEKSTGRMTRVMDVRPPALQLEEMGPSGNIEGYHLAFGEFSPARDFRDQSFTIDWGDGSVTGVEFDLYTTWAYSKEKSRRVPTVHSPIRVDGVERGEDYYDAWIVEIVR